MKQDSHLPPALSPDARIAALEAELAAARSEGEALRRRLEDEALSREAAIEAARREGEAELARRNQDLQAINEELAAQRDEIVRANRDLAEQRRFAEQLVQRLPGGVTFVDADLVVRVANEAYARFSGKPLEALVDRPFYDVFPGTEPQIQPVFDHVRETGAPFHASAYEVPLPGVGLTWWDFTMLPMTDMDGRFTGYLTMAFEVSERIRLEREVADQKEMLERIVEHAPAGIAFYNRDLVFRMVNPAHLRQIGTTAERVIGRSLNEVWGPDADRQVGGLMRRVIETGEPYSATGMPFEHVVDGRPGTSYWDFTYAPVFGQDDVVQGVLVLAHEVTDRMEREQLMTERLEALQQADRYKDEFLSVISHELRTPLNFIMGFGSVLDDELQGALNDRQHDAVGKILTGAERMTAIVDDLLDFARMQAGRFHLARERAELAPLVAEVAAAAYPRAASRAIAIETAVAPGLVAEVDAARVVQVLNNLVGNAVKFSRDGGRIAIDARREDGFIRCEVTDDGRGIAPEDLGRLFTRFQQLDMGATRQVGGTGLGLAISRAIVEAHGGSIGVRSHGMGHGATFWFTLPVEADGD